MTKGTWILAAVMVSSTKTQDSLAPKLSLAMNKDGVMDVLFDIDTKREPHTLHRVDVTIHEGCLVTVLHWIGNVVPFRLWLWKEGNIIDTSFFQYQNPSNTAKG